jgi:membrane protein YdbS with pleckstrin-like domain
MRRERLESAATSRHRRSGFVLAAVALALLVAMAINVWLAVTMTEWWPLALGVLELLGAVASGAYACRYFLRARRVTAVSPDEPEPLLLLHDMSSSD